MSEVKPLLSVEKLKTCFELDEGTVKAVDGVSSVSYTHLTLPTIA